MHCLDAGFDCLQVLILVPDICLGTGQVTASECGMERAAMDALDIAQVIGFH